MTITHCTISILPIELNKPSLTYGSHQIPKRLAIWQQLDFFKELYFYTKYDNIKTFIKTRLAKRPSETLINTATATVAVAPFAGACVETLVVPYGLKGLVVAPFAGACVETFLKL